jgi:hypothetical protein
MNAGGVPGRSSAIVLYCASSPFDMDSRPGDSVGSASETVTVDKVVGTRGSEVSAVIDVLVDEREHMPGVSSAPTAHVDAGLPLPADSTSGAVRVNDVVGTFQSMPIGEDPGGTEPPCPAVTVQ